MTRAVKLRPRHVLILSAAVLAALLALLVGGMLAGSQAAAPGNDGTVKIHDGASEVEPIVRNQPHVCTFHLHFFFADPAQAGEWEILSWAPTGNRAVVLAGTYLTDAAGEDRNPAAPATYALVEGHYRLQWEGRNERQIKHKMFWVECPGGPAGDVGPSASASASPTGGVLTETVPPGVTPPATDQVAAARGSTGGGGGMMPAILVGLTAAVLLLLRGPRRRRGRRNRRP
jgi:hypothetical protein